MAVGSATMAILGGVKLASGIMQVIQQQRQHAQQVNAANMQAQAYMQQGAYNAELAMQQAKMIEQQKKIADFQSRRRIASMRGDLTAMTAGKGLLFSGSPAAIMVDNESQLRYDAAIEKYNLDVRKNYYKSTAAWSQYSGLQQAGLARASVPAKPNMFAGILNAVGDTAMMFAPGGGGLGGRGTFQTSPLAPSRATMMTGGY